MQTQRNWTCTALCALILAANAPHALAEKIVVTTRADVVADDGRCSLREAVTAANEQTASGTLPGECLPGDPAPTIDTIQIPAGHYRLTRGDAMDDDNLGGDLDITDSVELLGDGFSSTTIENGIGAVDLVGDGDRILHIHDPSPTFEMRVVVWGVTLQGGDVACEGAGCAALGSAVEMSGEGELVFEESRVRRNTGTCRGAGCGEPLHTAAIRAVGGASLSILGGKIEENRASCFDSECDSGAAAIALESPNTPQPSFQMIGTRLSRNEALCAADACRVGPVVGARTSLVELVDIGVIRNEAGCLGASCRTDQLIDLQSDSSVHLTSATLRRNRLFCEGPECNGEDLLRMLTTTGIVLEGVRAKANDTVCSGFRCDVDDVFALFANSGPISIHDLVFTRNLLSCVGEDCDTDDAIDVSASAGTVTLDEVIATRNQNECTGTDCDIDDVIDVGSYEGTVVVERSDFSRNEALCFGEDCDTDNIIDIFSDGLTARALRIRGNQNRCVGVDCDTDDIVDAGAFNQSSLVLEHLSFRGNSVSCEGDLCDVDSILDLFGEGSTTLIDVETSKNELVSIGLDGDVDDLIDIASGGPITVVQARIERNHAVCRGDSCDSESMLVIRGNADSAVLESRIAKNESVCDGAACTHRNGGALSNISDFLTVTDTSIVDNYTGGDGAGVYNGGAGGLALVRSLLAGNEAGGRGGAIYNAPDAPGTLLRVLSARDCEIRGNSALVSGGGIFNEGFVFSLSGTSFEHNQPAGSDCVDAGPGQGCDLGL